MDRSRMRKAGAKAATVAYAGYKWFEDHTDDVERWATSARKQAAGKRYERAVGLPADAAAAAAKWVRNRVDEKGTVR
jgi:hypothetical protein